jgi:hypothetical protein
MPLVSTAQFLAPLEHTNLPTTHALLVLPALEHAMPLKTLLVAQATAQAALESTQLRNVLHANLPHFSIKTNVLTLSALALLVLSSTLPLSSANLAVTVVTPATLLLTARLAQRDPSSNYPPQMENQTTIAIPLAFLRPSQTVPTKHATTALLDATHALTQLFVLLATLSP